MKNLFAVMLAVTFLALPVAMAQYTGHEHGKAGASSAAGAAKEPAEKVVYKCPMHSEEISSKPDKCPKCNMKMEQSNTTTAYHCPTHLDVVSDKPGTCPKCKGPLYPYTHPERFESK